MKKLIFFITLLSLTGAAHGSDTQFFFQNEKGEHIVTPGLETKILAYETNSFKDNYISTGVNAGYSYGLLDSLSLGINLGFSSTYNSSETKSTGVEDNNTYSGLNDIDVSLVGRSKIGEKLTLRYGATFSISPEPSKTDSNGDLDNQMTGENEFRPYVGIDTLIGSQHRVGGKLQRSFLLGKQVSEDSTGLQTKSTGLEVTVVQAFYEFNWNWLLVGAALGYSNVGDQKNEAGTVTHESVDYFMTSVFANVQLGQSWTLVPQVDSETLLTDDVNGVEIESYANVLFSFSARYSF